MEAYIRWITTRLCTCSPYFPYLYYWFPRRIEVFLHSFLFVVLLLPQHSIMAWRSYKIGHASWKCHSNLTRTNRSKRSYSLEKTNYSPPLFLDRSEVKIISGPKYLRPDLGSKLSYNKHITAKMSKAMKVIYLLCKLQSIWSCSFLLTSLLYSLVLTKGMSFLMSLLINGF